MNENLAKLAQLFPNAITETINDAGEVIQAVDFDILKQELSDSVIEGRALRYEFNWPDKNKALSMANNPTDNTLRLDRDKSTGRDGTPRNIDTENIYIEGDNLEALKILRHTYMGKVKMIYIDPPYNTGNDFIYNDDFTISADEYEERYGEIEGRYSQNLASNGRFHTDWLNMIYPRLKVARDFLSPDGVIFISIDDNEVANLRKVCDEIFGSGNFVAEIAWKGRGGRQDSKYFAVIHEYILCYARDIDRFKAGEELKEDENFPLYDEQKRLHYKTQLLRKWGSNSRREDRPNLYYPITAPDGTDLYPMLSANEEARWRWGVATMNKAIKEGRVEFKQNNGTWIAYEKIDETEGNTKKYTTWIDDIPNGTATLKQLSIPFDYSKSYELILRLLRMANVNPDSIVMDFFSGSATTAHAVMALNNSDGGRRKFILIQLPEVTSEKSEARKAGYETICDIGEERIRRAGKKIREESPLTTGDLDVGFRVFRVDSSNMKDVYKRPEEYIQSQLEMFIENIKPDRRPEDLLIQVMLELGIELSAKIEEEFVAGKHVFIVEDGHLIACFDERINNFTVTAIAKRQPDYVAFRDSCFENDAVITNFDQIILAYSPKTQWIIL